MTERRVFSTTHTLNYIDYNNSKNGNEIIKTTKNNNEHTIFNKYLSYAQRKTINKSYFNFFKNEINVIGQIGNLRDNNNSFLSPQNKNILDEVNNDCILNVQMLLPRGNIIKTDTTPQSFNHNLNISKCCEIKNNKHIISNISKMNVSYECKCYKINNDLKCICCKLKPLFI